MPRTSVMLLVACLLASACQQALPAPSTPPASAPVPPAPTFLDVRVPIGTDLRVDLPARTNLLDASGETLFGVQSMVEPPRGFHLLVATPPAHAWRVAYTSAANASTTASSVGSAAQRTFIESTFGFNDAAFDVVTVDVVTGTARTLDRSTVPLGMVSRLAQRTRPAAIGNGKLVAWTRVQAQNDGFVWELYETAPRVPDSPVRLVKRSDQPLVPLAFDGRLAYVIVGPERDELWVYDRSTGSQSAWPTTAAGITAAAWSEAGLIVAKIDVRVVGSTNTIVALDERGLERPLVNATPCARPAASGRYFTWTCPRGTDLRAYDLRTGAFPLVARSPGAFDFHVSGDSFVWTEVVAGKNTARLLRLPP